MNQSSEEMVSIVIPAYNVEKYICSCLDSVLSQSYKNIEVIVVDDGSTDATGKIVDQYCLNDSRIKVIHNENGGLSAARNTGIKQANGRMLLYIDSDDVIDHRMIEKLVKIKTEKKAEVISCRYCLINEGDKIFSAKKNPKTEIKTCDSRQAIIELLSEKKASTSAWGKLAETKLWKEVVFPEGRKFEDLPVTWKLFDKAQRVVIFSEQLYGYRRRTSSISQINSASERSVRDYYDSIQQLELDIKKINLDQDLKKALSFRVCIECARLMQMCERNKHFTILYNLAKRKMWENLSWGVANKYASLRQRLRIIVTFISPKLSYMFVNAQHGL